MFKRSLICATFAGIMGVATGAVAAPPAVPTSTMIANPSIEQVHWWRGGYYPYHWRGNYYRHRRWYGNGWRYW